ncbi:hypothetical protein DMB41_16255 [Pectobacterium carotovorum subsp. carotovorum]|nr:hypothetical protein DMB41_16255 [Pectobacterium carotovorum subsp. carotovorum]
MDGKVKIALYALREHLKLHDEWRDLARKFNYASAVGKARRMALLRHAQGVVMHDRILTERAIKG